MNPSRSIAIISMLTAAVTVAAIAQVEAPGTFDLSWNTVDGGGGKSSGGPFELTGTIGQHDAGTLALTGGSFSLTGGFWPGASEPPVNTCPSDISGDGVTNTADLLSVINSWGACPIPCPPGCAADIVPSGGDCAVNTADLLAVINGWGLCP